VTGSTPHRVDPEEERRHQAGDETLWNESYYLDFVDDAGTVAGYVRIGLYPNLGVTWWTAMVVGEGRPVLASVDYGLPLPTGTAVALATDHLVVELGVAQPLEAMTVQATVPAVAFEDAMAVYDRRPGQPTTVGLDLTWTTDGVPYHYDVTTRYEVPCLVSGEITVGEDRMTVVGQGQRDHSWGVRDWWAFGWCWAAARLDDGTRVHVADIRIPGQQIALGYVQPSAGGVQTVEGLVVTEELGAGGLPTAARIEIEPGSIDLEIQPIAFGPLVLTAPDGRISRFPRAAARFVASDGRTGTGWIEWNQPGPVASVPR
jgi:hypothetical protein